MHWDVDGNNTRDEQYWAHHYRDRDVSAWQGYSFEQVCLIHLPHITHLVEMKFSELPYAIHIHRFVTQTGRFGLSGNLVGEGIDGVCPKKYGY